MKLLVRIFTALNVFFYRVTGGILGSRMAGQSMLLLFTTGRRSGKTRVIPISYFRDGETYILIASNWGKD
jgi:F420H(2)-dependent quinone reductase